MDALLAVLSIVFAAAAVFASYHVAARQGYFGKERVLLTLSDPVPLEAGQPPPRFSKEVRVRGVSRHGSVNQFFFKMPLLVVYGLLLERIDCIVFLLVTLINQKSALLNEVKVVIELPSHLMPDDLFDTGQMKAPDEITVRRHIDASTNEGQVTYEVSRLRPHDHISISEPIVFRSSELMNDDEGPKVSDLRLLLFTNRAVSVAARHHRRPCSLSSLNSARIR